MRILLVGGGGREHALAWVLARHGHDLRFTEANPGFEGLGRLVGGDPLDAAQGVDLVVIGPEAPLAAGLVDTLAARGIPAFGPSAAAARLESSKVYTKAFALRHGLPTAAARVPAPPAIPTLPPPRLRIGVDMVSVEQLRKNNIKNG